MSCFYELQKFQQTSSRSWSSPRVVILSAEDPDQLESQLNCVLASDDFHVLALSAATTTATYLAEPFIATVVIQEKLDPLMGDKS
jgi:hypothetical protein